MSSFSPFGVGNAGGFAAIVLPVELLDFKGRYISPFGGQGAGNLLTWTTANEQNTVQFDIERSINGQTFEKIGTVKTKGSNSTYEFTDNAPSVIWLFIDLK